MKNGEIVADKQRDEEYTRLLSQRIVEEFHKYNEVLPSILVAFVGYLQFRKQRPGLDLYEFLRLPEDELMLDYGLFLESVGQVTQALRELEHNEKLLLAPEFEKSTEDIVTIGLTNLGMYHSKRPLLVNEDGNIITQDLNLLFFYHNRLVGYNLDKYV